MASTGLPPNWEVRHSNSKNLPYYFNPATKDSRWEPPSGTDVETLKTYMATHHTGVAPSHANGTSHLANGAGAENGGKIRAAHLLVKHRESRKPSSWREAEITRSKDEAMNIIRGYKEKIERGDVSLGDLAGTESDCPSARKRGDLGYFGHGEMQKPFEEAAFALQPGQMSDVVTSSSGLHLIQRYD